MTRLRNTLRIIASLTCFTTAFLHELALINFERLHRDETTRG